MSSTDYIIVGGGLVGAALATRLSEDPSVNVTIIEAGGENFHDETIDVPSKVYQNFGNPNFDWAFMSTPQLKLNGRPVFLPNGKGLGGSSLINLMFVNRAPSEEYNDIARLAGEGWGWDDLQPYFRKSETLIRNEEDAKKYGARYLGQYGTSGPVKRSLPHSINAGALAWVEAFIARGIQHNPDTTNGHNRGVGIHTRTLDACSVRSSSASAYYEPNKTRPNLNVISNAHATRILTSVDGLVTATGVEYLKGDSVHVLHAKKEIIVCCGAFKTPQLLELSGIGDAKLLESLDIAVVVDLPGVGNNLREGLDHPLVTLTAKLKPGHESAESLLDAEFAKKQEELFNKEGTGLFVSAGTPAAAAFLSFKDFDDDGSIARFINNLSLPDHPTFKVQKEWVKNENIPFLEFNTFDMFIPGTVAAPEPGARYQTSGLILMHSFTRGSVHITSKDASAPPEIDLNIVDETDLKIFVKAYKILRDIHNTEPFKTYIEGEVSPGAGVNTDDEIIEYVKNSAITSFHPSGTASMLPRKDRGVVNADLKVYGTTNLRVVDASILPVHLSAHLQSTLYAFAEKAADIIKSCK